MISDTAPPAISAAKTKVHLYSDGQVNRGEHVGHIMLMRCGAFQNGQKELTRVHRAVVRWHRPGPTRRVRRSNPAAPTPLRDSTARARRNHLTVVVSDAVVGHIVGRGGKGLHQAHDASPTERRVSIRGTDQQIGEALIALGKRFMRMRAFAGSNSAAPPPHSGILPLGLGGTTSRLWCPTRLSGISLAEVARAYTGPMTFPAPSCGPLPTRPRRLNAASLSEVPTSKSVKRLLRLGSGSCASVSARRRVPGVVGRRGYIIPISGDLMRLDVEDGEDQTGNVDAEFGTKTILDAEAGYFGKEHNRVEEEDARNATELIQKFRSKREKNKSPNNAVQPVSPSRNSLGRGGTSSPSSPIMKKREGEKNGGNEGRAKRARTEYRDELAWDRRIKCIDAVEWAGQTLYIYFTLHGGEHMTED
ncbi:hypothetical protein B0H13DRAFT_1857153 [Mycena leptocephala]|nr:hypothetical protein B0H13DRAFT_1857153 [Mycena leptocephala]